MSFQESHLRQLRYLLPEYVSLETINLPSYSGSRTFVAHTVLTLAPQPPGESCASLRSLFRQRLVDYLLTTCRNHSDGVGLPDGETISLSQVRTIFPKGVPDVPEVGTLEAQRVHILNTNDTDQQTTQSPSLAGDKQEETPEKPIVSGGRLSLSDGSSLIETRGSEQRSSGKSDGHSVSVGLPGAESNKITEAPKKQRRLSFNSSGDFEKKGADSNRLLQNMPLELRRRSVDGIISMDSLQKLEQNEALHRRLSTSEARSAREFSAAIGSLPQVFSSIRRILGPRGPNVMKLDVMICRLLDGGPELSSESEVRTAVKLLVQHAPEFLEIKPWGSCGTPAIWINRRCDMKAIAERLKALSLR